jgi:hypothetical protein
MKVDYIVENKIKLEDYGLNLNDAVDGDLDIDVDTLEEIARDYGLCSYVVCEITQYGNVSTEVLMWCDLTEDWEHYRAYHADINELSEPYPTESQAIAEMNRVINKKQKSVSSTEASATQEELDRYEEFKSNFEANRNSYYGYCRNGGGGRKAFQDMYGSGELPSLAEWLIIDRGEEE